MLASTYAMIAYHSISNSQKSQELKFFRRKSIVYYKDNEILQPNIAKRRSSNSPVKGTMKASIPGPQQFLFTTCLTYFHSYVTKSINDPDTHHARVPVR